MFPEAWNSLVRSLANRKATAQTVVQALLDVLIPPFAWEFEDTDVRQSSEFLMCAHRILECLRRLPKGSRREGWDRVCERLIALPRPE